MNRVIQYRPVNTGHYDINPINWVIQTSPNAYAVDRFFLGVQHNLNAVKLHIKGVSEMMFFEKFFVVHNVQKFQQKMSQFILTFLNKGDKQMMPLETHLQFFEVMFS